VHDNVDAVFRENFGNGVAVAQVFIKEGDIAGDGGAVPVDEVIENKGGVTGSLELSDAVATNVACASDDENVHGGKLSFQFEVSSLKFGYYGHRVEFDIRAYLETFCRTAAGCGFERDVIAEVGGYEIPAFTKLATGMPRVYISSGIHGDEPAGVFALMEMMADGCFDDKVEWRVCPVMNPTGLAAGVRENAQEVDLNRDYLRRASAEVRGHVGWLERQPVPDVVLSLHEDWESTGFYLYEIQKCACASVAHSILEAASAEIGPEPSPLIDGHQVREPGWIFHEPRSDFPGDWPEAIYMAELGTRVSYTLETPSSLALESRVACHKLAVCKAVEEFLLTRGA
jgi:protein MpaA